MRHLPRPRIHPLEPFLFDLRGKLKQKRCFGLAAEFGFWSFYSAFPFITFIAAISSFFHSTPNPEKGFAGGEQAPGFFRERLGAMIIMITWFYLIGFLIPIGGSING